MNIVRKLMSADQFLEWRQNQPGRWELVGGAPIQMVAGAKQRRDRIVVNLILALGPKLRGGPCRPWSADIAIRTPAGNVRQPDVTVDCGPVKDDALESTAPTVAFEVLSPSTRTFDQVRKVDEYKTVPSLRQIVLIDTELPRVVVWTRASESAAWSDRELGDIGSEIELSAAGVALGLAEIYDGIEFESAP